MTNKVNLTSEDIKEDRLGTIKALFPEVVTENQIDWDKLRKALGEDLDNQIEKFNFTWAGKSKAIKAVLEPSKATLKPSKGEGVRFDESENIFVEGDNLEVLKLLQKAYFEKVKMIYIDPPYNTGRDFIYKDDFKSPIDNYLKQTGQKNVDGEKLTSNSETNGRFHSDWLNMMYPRLKLAWNLLRDDGVIFISIDDNELANLKKICDEIFGEDNLIENFTWHKKNSAKGVPPKNMVVNIHEYVLCYSKNGATKLTGEKRTSDTFANPDNDARGLWRRSNIKSTIERGKDKFSIKDPNTGNEFTNYWAFSKLSLEKMISEDRILFPANSDGLPKQKEFLSEFSNPYMPTMSYLGMYHSQDSSEKSIDNLMDIKSFLYRKPINLMKKLVDQGTKLDNELILDFFSGSGTTAHAVMQLNAEDGGNRKWIMVQLPEPISKDSEAYKAGYRTIAEITKERIRRVIKGYGENHQPIDDGFKVFRLDKSNYPENNFEYDPEKTDEENQQEFKAYLAKAGQMPMYESDNEINIIYEIIVKEGLSLNSKINIASLGSNSVYVVSGGEQTLHICLEQTIKPDTIKALTIEEYKNKVFICKDSAVDDTAKANLSLNLELKTI